MDMKDNIRQRRLDRLKELRDSSRRPELQETERNYEPFMEPKLYQQPVNYAGRYEEGPLDDPEFVWNKKMEREHGATVRYPRYNQAPPPRYETPSTGQIRLKVILSAFGFALIWGMFQWNQPLAVKGADYVRTALTESYDFKQLAAWYNTKFSGTTTLLPALRSFSNEEAQKVSTNMTTHYFAPVQGKIITPFEPSRLGIVLQTKADSPVFALDTGRVISSGKKDDAEAGPADISGYTVVIQHASGLQSTYSGLEQPRVAVNDWIKGGETVGTAARTRSAGSGADGATLFFAVSKNSVWINPAEVVSFDQ
ncbi:M23 family metallopeptidase [Paenibacillus thalictri]|uniref:M23 family metallopeptidase n=1 Tax=Paenibacillus thalictri TaxID=2527873 RepID=A0A4Q9DYU7_9BACL|nr:M23 family metallopeptidase [Paenibacillus thalictri]TBL81625.1 M23 family metallopeptidase [Paenibacillus thalictri]